MPYSKAETSIFSAIILHKLLMSQLHTKNTVCRKMTRTDTKKLTCKTLQTQKIQETIEIARCLFALNFLALPQ